MKLRKPKGELAHGDVVILQSFERTWVCALVLRIGRVEVFHREHFNNEHHWIKLNDKPKQTNESAG